MSFLKKEADAYFTKDTHLEPHRYAIITDKHIAYLINCKAACSSLMASLMEEDINMDHLVQDQNDNDYYPIHRKAEQRRIVYDELDAEGAAFFTFTFVRNPFSRLVSCYEDKYHKALKINNGRRAYDNYLCGYMARDEGFTAFIKKVCSLPYRLMDRHFKRQYDLIYDSKGNSRCDYIGHFETLKDDFDPIRIRYGLADLPHLNQTDIQNWMDY